MEQQPEQNNIKIEASGKGTVSFIANQAAGFVKDKIVKKLASTAVVKAAQALVTKAASTIGSAIGSVVPVVGTAIGAAVGAIIGKNLKKLGQLTGGAILLAVTGMIQGVGALFGAIAAMLGIAATSVGIVAGIIILTVPPLVAFIFLVINSSAYVVPRAKPISLVGIVNLPEGCPAPVWPVHAPEGQAAQGYAISQGPGGTATHGPPAVICKDLNKDGVIDNYEKNLPGNCRPVTYQEAIDVSTVPRGDSGNPNRVVISTHEGTVTSANTDEFGGLYVKIKDTCGGNFYTQYVHMDQMYPSVGQTVKIGDPIGIVGCTGYCDSAHVHYEFRNSDGSTKNRNDGDSPPFMSIPYLPVDVPEKCIHCPISFSI